MSGFNPSSEHPLLVFGGPYSNLEATTAMRKFAEEQQIPPCNILCTGDLVAYCASPEETVNLIRDWNISVVLGNCEESIGNDADDCGCGFEEGSSCNLLSVAWYNYSRPRIGQDNKSWMADLPSQLRFRFNDIDCLAIHGGINSINQFIFPSTSPDEKQSQLKQAGTDIIIGGHSGIPFGENTGNGYWLNAGVVGMPANDGTADTWYMLLTPQNHGIKASWHRLKYDAETCAEKMAAAGLNYGYEKAIISGLWPSTDILPTTEADTTGSKLILTPLDIP
ncbi:metallophosphoesterase family protein [Amphritea sp. HPY]|uniref:metallophosphoesterase family protein n=1 Tax=Amphritea sp. HPY TaxID=3421652 RepID=UPI003D7DD16C